MTLGALLLLALAAGPLARTSSTSSTTPVRRDRPLVALFPSDPVWSAGEDPPPEKKLARMSGELNEAAADVFNFRRWELMPGEPLDRAIKANDNDECLNPTTCRGKITRKLGCTHWLASTLRETKGRDCVIEAQLHVLPSNMLLARDTRTVHPCTDDNLLAAAGDLGRSIAEGVRAPVTVTLSLTPLELPSLDIPSIDNLSHYQTSSVAKTRSHGFELDRALEIYAAKHMVLFDDQESGEYYIARGGRLQTECDARLAASADMEPRVREYCFGNDWEWAWLGAPAGGLVALGSLSGFQDGDLVGVVGFTLGMGTAIASVVLALYLNQDAKDPEDHVYLSSREELEALVKTANEKLRHELDLSEAEVEVAGLGL